MSPTQTVQPRADPWDRVALRVRAVSESRWPLAGLAALLVVSVAALTAGVLEFGPTWIGEVGAAGVATGYTWALAARTGGRPVVFGTLALVLGAIAVTADVELLRTGAAVLTCAVSAVLAVMATVPAVRVIDAIRECLFALLVAALGAVAVVAFEPTVTVARFEYVSLGVALVSALVLVYRLGAGLHGLGRRGLVIVLVGGVVVAVTLLYGELLRRYGEPGLVDSLLGSISWSRQNLGAFPRPIVAGLGVPALLWGCHMRARRRQGWWVCAFAVAATSATASSLINTGVTVRESTLAIVYGLIVGIVIGYLVIRVDLALTGGRGRRSVKAEQAAALRPEPRRTQALL